ncbi:MAG: energy transducer TonB, partial [Gammaproteobacteria bacterium]|nr:energy transducer TonB [Gammaproteobacteria bacterium]
EPPPELRQQSEVVNIDNAWSSDFRAPLAQIDMSRSAAFSSDGEYLPILKVQPVYPRYALQKGQFGWVLLEFTVNESGKVINPVVIDNCVENFKPGRFECIDRPGRIFDRPAIAAAQKFKYKPRIVDGTPIETQGVIHKISFVLDEMRNL